MALKDGNLGFLGGGAMAQAIIGGLLQRKAIPPQRIWASDPDQEKLAFLRENYGINVTARNKDVTKVCSRIILAVKPAVVFNLLKEVGGDISPGSLVISIVAGVTIENLQKFLSENVQIVRVMPNTPALIGVGAAAYALGPGAEGEEELVREIFGAIGSVVKVSEEQLDAVTGLSGSGPAYVFLFIEALIEAGVRVGLPREVARTLAVDTVLGSAKLVRETGEHPAKLRENVTTPGGTTIAGLQALELGRFRGIIMEAVLAATNRAAELSQKNR